VMDEACARLVRIMLQPLPRAGEEVNRQKRLTQCQRPWRVKCETRAMRDERERQDGRDGRKHRVMHEPKFRVRSSENLELRTSNRRPSRRSRTAILRECSPVVSHVRTIEVLACQHSCSVAC
jgi:hypothetical protein